METSETSGRVALLVAGLPLLSGFLFSAGLAPLELPAASLVLYVPLLVAVRRLRPAGAALASIVFGVSAAVLSAWWVYGAMHGHYHQPVLASATFTVLVVGGGVGVFLAAPVFLYRLLAGAAGGSSGWWRRPLLLASLVFLAELLRTHGSLSMPWGLAGSGLGASPVLVQSADLFGALGHSFVCALVGGFLAGLLEARLAGLPVPRRPALAAGTMLLVLYGYGFLRTAQVRETIRFAERNRKPLRVAAVQANIPQGERWDASLVPRNMNRHIELSREVIEREHPAVVVWPETAMNTYITDGGDIEYRSRIYALALEHGVHFLLGGPHLDDRSDGPARYFNSVFQLSPGTGLSARYDKRQLLPFAEYNPFGNLPLLPKPEQVPVDYTPAERVTLFEIGGAKVGTMICFEALYPWIARDLVSGGASVLLNVSNDAWFGRTKAPDQHFSQARVRAVELRRYLVRNAGTGITGFFNPLGEAVGPRLGIFTEGTVAADVYPLEGLTLYAKAGDWPLGLLSLTVALAAVLAAVRRPVKEAS